MTKERKRFFNHTHSVLLSVMAFFFTLPLQGENPEPTIQKAEYQFYLNEQGKEVLHGVMKKFYANGQLSTKSTFKHGVKTGNWTTWYNNGQKKSEEIYMDGLLTGERTSWHINGEKKSQEYYSIGRLHGDALEWYESGFQKSKISYAHGDKEGLSVHWHPNGKKKTEMFYKKNKLHGKVLTWDEEGDEISKKLYRDGKELKIFLKMEKFANGQPKIAYHYFLDDDLNEIKHGKYDKWFPNGEKWISCEYFFNQLNGEYVYGKKDGIDYRVESYEKGVKHGRFVWYHYGELKKEEFWDKGKRVHQKIY